VITLTSEIRANCRHERAKKFGKSDSGAQRYRCLDCGKTWVDSTRTLDGMRVGLDKAEQIVNCMMEGMGVRSTARLAGVANDTVLGLLVLIGGRCKVFTEQALVNVKVKEVQADEIWSYVGCKERTRVKNSRSNRDCGDRYCYVGMERTTKLALTWHLGPRDAGETATFVTKLVQACHGGKLQITTDGWMPYKREIREQLPRADFGMLIKLFRNPGNSGTYSPGQIISVKRKPIQGNPSYEAMCTSHVERHNLSMRMKLRRFTRLTNGFSRKLENHAAALGLYFAHYNWVQKHGAHKTTPAVASGVAEKPWTVRELIDETMGFKPPRPKTAFERFLDTIPDEEPPR